MNQEAKTAAYFQAHGFLVKRDLKIAIESTPIDATDIDVLAIRFTEPFNEEKIVIDCKDKRKPRPFERVLWTSGLKKACDATRAIVVLPQAPWQAFAFAQDQQVELLKEDSIENFLRNEKNYSPYGDALELTAENESKFRSMLLEEDRDLIRDNHKLRSMLINGHPLTNFNGIVNILSRLNQKYARNSFAFSWYYRMVAFNSAVIASVMLLRFISEVKWLDEKDWRDYARKKLTYGDMPVQKAVSLARTAFNSDFFDGLPEPHYCAEVLDLIDTLMRQRSMSQLPCLVDRFLFGHVLLVRELEPPLEKAQNRAVKQLLSVLSYASDIAAEFWTQPLKQTASDQGASLRSAPYNPKKQYSKKDNQQSGADIVHKPNGATEISLQQVTGRVGEETSQSSEDAQKTNRSNGGEKETAGAEQKSQTTADRLSDAEQTSLELATTANTNATVKSNLLHEATLESTARTPQETT